MITRIKIDGFKAFKKFEIELGAFSFIAGTNGAGEKELKYTRLSYSWNYKKSF